MPSSPTIKKRRTELFNEQKGLCHYCKEPMLLIEWKSNSKESKHKPTPPDLCTLEHLFDRNDKIARRRNPKGEKRWVAACFACNNKQGAAREASIPIEELRRRSSKSRKWGQGSKHKKENIYETIKTAQS